MATDALTDPDEIELYNQYGPNWRRVIGSGMRDRGGRYDRSMRFNHGVPSGFMTRPITPPPFMPQPALDTGAYEKYRTEYDRLTAEYNSLLNQYNQYSSQQDNSYQNSAYDQMQQYYENNANNANNARNVNVTLGFQGIPQQLNVTPAASTVLAPAKSVLAPAKSVLPVTKITNSKAAGGSSPGRRR